MSGYLVAGAVLGSGLGLALLALVARRLSDRFGSDDPPLWRSLLWLVVAGLGLGALYFLRNEWVAHAIVVLVTAWALVGSALAERGSPLRCRLAVLELYAVLFASVRALALPTLMLCPLFVADGGAVLYRWLGRLRARALVFLLVAGAAVLLPALLFVLAALGVLSQLAGLRELLPFAALDETPLKRPRLGSMLVALGLSALCMAGAAGAAELGLGRVSPRLGAPTEVCGSTDPSVSWEARTATFELPGARFSMDLDETSLDGGDPSKLCERAGKRLCTSDEWYLACACTYPLEVEPGTKRSTLYAFVARAERERKAAAPGPREPTAAADKRSELRELITGRSEVVAQGKAKGLLLAGPNDTLRDPWTVDCRHRSFLTPSALDSGLAALAAVRCCR